MNVQGMYTENNKILFRKVNTFTNGEYIPFSWVRIFNTKMSVFHELMLPNQYIREFFW